MVWKKCTKCGIEYEHVGGPFKSDTMCGRCAREYWLRKQPIRPIWTNTAIEHRRKAVEK